MSHLQEVFLSQPFEKKYQSTQTPQGKVRKSFHKLQKTWDVFSFGKKGNKNKIPDATQLYLKTSKCIYITLIQSLIKAPENLREIQTQNN